MDFNVTLETAVGVRNVVHQHKVLLGQLLPHLENFVRSHLQPYTAFTPNKVSTNLKISYARHYLA